MLLFLLLLRGGDVYFFEVVKKFFRGVTCVVRVGVKKLWKIALVDCFLMYSRAVEGKDMENFGYLKCLV